jgi:hypothetical protein
VYRSSRDDTRMPNSKPCTSGRAQRSAVSCAVCSVAGGCWGEGARRSAALVAGLGWGWAGAGWGGGWGGVAHRLFVRNEERVPLLDVAEHVEDEGDEDVAHDAVEDGPPVAGELARPELRVQRKGDPAEAAAGGVGGWAAGRGRPVGESCRSGWGGGLAGRGSGPAPAGSSQLGGLLLAAERALEPHARKPSASLTLLIRKSSS